MWVQLNRWLTQKMSRRWFRVCGLLLSIYGAACTAGSPRIKPNLKVPAEFEHQDFEPPTGESERVRYLKAYQAFWYNCVTLLSEDIDARCPFTCSGTPAESAGCANGGTEAWNQIRDSIESYGEPGTQQVLRLIAALPETKAQMAAYFGEHPAAEYAPKP